MHFFCKCTQCITVSLELLYVSCSQIIISAQCLQFSSQLCLLFDFLCLLNHCNAWVMLALLYYIVRRDKRKIISFIINIYHRHWFLNLISKQWLFVLSNIALDNNHSQKDLLICINSNQIIDTFVGINPPFIFSHLRQEHLRSRVLYEEVRVWLGILGTLFPALIDLCLFNFTLILKVIAECRGGRECDFSTNPKINEIILHNCYT